MNALKILISPAKTIRDFTYDGETYKPLYLDLSKVIVTEMKKLSFDELKKLCKTSDRLTMKSLLNYRDFAFDEYGIPALFAYHGLQYKAIHPLSFDQDDLLYAQAHLRILSAVYGLLAPLDAIYPYRLEMQAPLSIPPYLNLYEFWKEPLKPELMKETIIDLASIEYSKVIHHEELSNYVRIEFYELRNNQYKAISTMVKVARGTMVHWLIKNKIKQKEQIKEFKELGYQLNTEKSNDQYYMFVR